jgi:hypothetical protein
MQARGHKEKVNCRWQDQELVEEKQTGHKRLRLRNELHISRCGHRNQATKDTAGLPRLPDENLQP